MPLSVLALALGLSAQPASARLPVSAPVETGTKAAEATVVYLGCQVALTSLTDCRVVNDGPVDPAAAVTALKLARAMTLPQALADRAAGHIVIKLNVTP